MNLLVATTLIGALTCTAYRPIVTQTDTSPYYTATGEHVTTHGIAVSQDLLVANGGPLNYGDLLYIEGIGFKFVNDCMNKRHKNSIDIFVYTKEEEAKVFKKFYKHPPKVWVIHPITKDK